MAAKGHMDMLQVLGGMALGKGHVGARGACACGVGGFAEGEGTWGNAGILADATLQ